jgi:hypothetical protein
MRLRHPLTLALGIVMLVAPAALLAAEPGTEPAAPAAAIAPATAAAPAETTAPATAAKPESPATPDAALAGKHGALEQCDKPTGSIIRPKVKDGCKPTGSLATRTYSKEDIERTGEFDLNEALRKLDPSFR